MGFFSQDCNGCGHPALSSMATQDKNDWMSHVVALQPNGSIIMGEYDGYGRVAEVDYAIGDGATVYHHRCWVEAGKPTDYAGPSEGSADQGWFFDDNAHNWASPAEAKAHRPSR